MIHLLCTLAARGIAPPVCNGFEHPRRLPIEPMNEWSVSGSCKEPPYVVLWVLREGLGRGAFAYTRSFRLAIRAPDNGHSLSAICPVSPSSTGHFGKEQSGTDFGKADDRKRLLARSPGRLSRFGFPIGTRSARTGISQQPRAVLTTPRCNLRNEQEPKSLMLV